MKIYGTVFGVLYFVLVSKCEDHHHIDQRILEKKDSPETTLLPGISEINKTKDSVLSNDINLQPSSENKTNPQPTKLGPSQELEQELDKIGSSVPPKNNVKVSQTVESAPLLQGNKTVIAPVVNITSLLRANDSTSHVYIGFVHPNETTIQAPKIFPNGTSVNGTKIIKGDSEKLQTLISQKTNTTEKTKNETNGEIKHETAKDTEVNDLLNNTDKAALHHQHQNPLEPLEPVQIPDKVNDDTELIENGQDTEDQLRNHQKLERYEKPDPQQTYLAAILVSSLVAVSVICYAALLLWRKYLENRYGSRTMLVNEEEFDDPNDLRHFSI